MLPNNPCSDQLVSTIPMGKSSNVNGMIVNNCKMSLGKTDIMKYKANLMYSSVELYF